MFATALTFQIIPPHKRQEWLQKIRFFPSEWLQKPLANERFESPKQCLERLNAWGLYDGSVFVTGNSRQGKLENTPSWEFICKLHSSQTANKRRLENRVVKDDETGEITTRRQRDTLNKRKNCPVKYVLSYK